MSKQSKAQPHLYWDNPNGGPGRLYVRTMTSGERRLYTSIGESRRACNTDRQRRGLVWPADDGSRRNRRGLTAEQQRVWNMGMEVLAARVDEMMHPERHPPEETQAPASTRVTLSRAVKEFKAEQDFDSFPISTRTRFNTAWTHFLGIQGEGWDMVMEYEALRARIVELKARCPLADVSQQKALYKLKVFFNYCVHREWLTKNPMLWISIPKAAEIEEIDENRMMMWSDADRLIEWSRSAQLPKLARFIEFLRLAGVRPAEALKARAADLTTSANGTHLIIYGKAVKGKKVRRAPDRRRSGVVRYIPLRDADGREMIPGICALVTQLYQDSEEIGQDGWLFPWRSTNAVRQLFNRGRDALGITGVMKQLRATAAWSYRERLGWDLELRCAVLGHSPAVQIRHYIPERQAEEVTARASRSAA